MNNNTIDIQKIYERVLAELKASADVEIRKTIPVEASARHIHLSQPHIEALFGKDYSLTIKKELSQPGQYQYEERLRLIGPKGVIDNVAILGPARDHTQVELSLTDARQLGISVPIKNSGDLQNTPGLYLSVGDNLIQLAQGVIVSHRHIHMSDKEAANLGLSQGDLVKVKVYGERPLIFEDVLIRVNPRYKLSMHIDIDEANACGLKKDTVGEIYV